MRKGRPKIDHYKKYVSGNEDVIKAACRTGATNEDLARLLGCGLSTVKTILREYPEFKTLVKDGKDVANFQVENALFKRALGYDYEEMFTEIRLNQDGSGTTTYVKKTKKHVPGDVTAQNSWLRNREKEKWNKAFEKDEAPAQPPPDLSKLSVEDLRQWESLMKKIGDGGAK